MKKPNMLYKQRQINQRKTVLSTRKSSVFFSSNKSDKLNYLKLGYDLVYVEKGEALLEVGSLHSESPHVQLPSKPMEITLNGFLFSKESGVTFQFPSKHFHFEKNSDPMFLMQSETRNMRLVSSSTDLRRILMTSDDWCLTMQLTFTISV